MRRRLILTVLAVTAMVTVAFLVPLGAVVKVVAADRALSVADQEARSLAGVLASGPTTASLTAVVAQLDADSSGRSVAVYLPGGQLVGPALPVPHDQLALARQDRAFTAAAGGDTWVWVPVRLESGVVVGVVSVPGRLLTQGVLRAWLVLGLVGLAVLLLATALTDRLGRSLVRSIEDLGEVTRRLRRGELDARVVPAGPAEIAGVGRAVNELADRIIELLALEREEAADLSHRLRTPLAALQLEADTLPQEADRHRIGTAVRQLTEAVNGVILQVRQGRPTPPAEACDLATVVRQRLAFWSVLAEEQGRSWTADLPDGEVTVPSGPTELAAAVDALLGNVLAHTPERTAFRVAVTTAATGATLLVEDEGPGLPPGPFPVRGQSGAGSTGLGLDIARRTAERAGGCLWTGRAAGGGARVEMRFGPQPPPAAPAEA